MALREEEGAKREKLVCCRRNRDGVREEGDLCLLSLGKKNNREEPPRSRPAQLAAICTARLQHCRLHTESGEKRRGQARDASRKFIMGPPKEILFWRLQFLNMVS